MNSRQRFEALLAGKPADRVPRVLWHHFPHADFNADAFVEATLDFHRRHDLDFVKIGPRSSYCVRDYGLKDDPEVDHLGRPSYMNQVVREPSDWRKLRPLDPSAGWMGHTAECIRRIAAGVDPRTPVIATIFSPVTQAKNLAGITTLTAHWRDYPDDVRAGLATLADSTLRFVSSLDNARIDGLFYAIQECGLPAMAPRYMEMCSEFDHAILGARPSWLNVLHLHGKIIGFDDYGRYPVSVIHWDETESGISLAEGRDRCSKLVSGGLAWPDEGWPDTASLVKAARAAVSRNGTERLVLGAGCVIPHRTPPEHIQAFCSFDQR